MITQSIKPYAELLRDPLDTNHSLPCILYICICIFSRQAFMIYLGITISRLLI